MAEILSLVKNIDAAKPAIADVVAGLRGLANLIEAGEHGEVIRCAWVLRSVGREPIIGALGAMEHLAQAYMDFHAGAAELMSMTHPERS